MMDLLCCNQAYFCPTKGSYDCPKHASFTVCCNHPELHVSKQASPSVGDLAATSSSWMDDLDDWRERG